MHYTQLDNIREFDIKNMISDFNNDGSPFKYPE